MIWRQDCYHNSLLDCTHPAFAELFKVPRALSSHARFTKSYHFLGRRRANRRLRAASLVFRSDTDRCFEISLGTVEFRERVDDLGLGGGGGQFA